MKLINYVNFGDSENAQAIYSSQLYGTYFSIYALIETSEHEDSKNYKYNIKSIKLFLMNYKGVINLGITRAIIEPIFDNKIQIGAKLDIEIQGKYEMINELFEVDISNDFIGLNIKSKINTSRYLRPMHIGKDEDSTVNNRDTPLSSGIFDSEFYFREGQIMNEDMVRNENIAKTWDSRNEVKSMTGGNFCPYSTSIVL
ncbi:hypothetical protein [Polaribacter sp. Asnod6-C07]|uniref:hypothetical protein n=1 Tax=Polaribacter sp. Asnod6-C07 TaxID=3160582 RepID=UPI0038650A29